MLSDLDLVVCGALWDPGLLRLWCLEIVHLYCQSIEASDYPHIRTCTSSGLADCTPDNDGSPLTLHGLSDVSSGLKVTVRVKLSKVQLETENNESWWGQLGNSFGCRCKDQVVVLVCRAVERATGVSSPRSIR